MSSVIGLGYMGFEVSDSSAWDKLLQQILGLELREDTAGDISYYRMDSRHHRVSLYRGAIDRVKYIGWEVAEREDLEAVAQRLEASGVLLARGTPEECRAREVIDLIRFEDLDSFPLEVFYNAKSDKVPFKPARPMSGFRTGKGYGMGHMALHCKDMEASVKWYREMLGFGLSDYCFWPDPASGGEARATFLHCNKRQHALAIANECFGKQGGQFNHLMIEAETMDDVGRAYDITQELDYPLGMTMGRHANDGMTTFYVWAPSGSLMIEYGYGGNDLNPDSWKTEYYDATSRWGHQLQMFPGV